jgi:hypothetical protein
MQDAPEHLTVGPGAKKKTAAAEQYEALKRNLEDKERALAELAVKVSILGEKPMGVRGKNEGPLA